MFLNFFFISPTYCLVTQLHCYLVNTSSFTTFDSLVCLSSFTYAFVRGMPYGAVYVLHRQEQEHNHAFWRCLFHNDYVYHSLLSVYIICPFFLTFFKIYGSINFKVVLLEKCRKIRYKYV